MQQDPGGGGLGMGPEEVHPMRVELVAGVRGLQRKIHIVVDTSPVQPDVRKFPVPPRSPNPRRGRCRFWHPATLGCCF
ncbi:hypothetical protein GCM10023085_53890 [Actinomadura viridis]